MKMKQSRLLFVGVTLEALLFLVLFFTHADCGDLFRLSARYTGRISFGLYIVMFYYFIFERSRKLPLVKTKVWGMVFCVLHLIHFGFLSASVYFNDLPIIPIKLAGGFLAYLAIVIYPFFIQGVSKLWIHVFYFYYVGFVMGMTFLSRIKGDFEGADPSWFHYFGLLVLALMFLIGIIKLLKK